MSWWGPPGWTPEGEIHPPFPSPQRGYDARGVPSLGVYVVPHLLLVSIATGMALTFEQQATSAALVVASLYIVWTGMGWAGLFEQRKWVVPVELSRLVTMAAAALWWGNGQALIPVLLTVAVVTLCAASAAWVWTRREALVA